MFEFSKEGENRMSKHELEDDWVGIFCFYFCV